MSDKPTPSIRRPTSAAAGLVAAHETFKTVEDPSKPSYYALGMFPYPSGAGLTWATPSRTRPSTSWPGTSG